MRKICCFFIFFLFVGCNLSFAETINVTANKSGGYVEVIGDILTVEIPNNIPEKTLKSVLTEPNVVKVANMVCRTKIVEIIKVIETCTYDEFKFDLNAKQVISIGSSTYISDPKYGFVYSCLLLTALLYLYPTIFYWRLLKKAKDGDETLSNTEDKAISLMYMIVFFILFIPTIWVMDHIENYETRNIFIVSAFVVNLIRIFFQILELSKYQHIFAHYINLILNVLFYIMITLAIYNM